MPAVCLPSQHVNQQPPTLHSQALPSFLKPKNQVEARSSFVARPNNKQGGSKAGVEDVDAAIMGRESNEFMQTDVSISRRR